MLNGTVRDQNDREWTLADHLGDAGMTLVTLRGDW
jgi:hypothetical protein